MEEIIKRIMEIEDKAQEIMTDARKKHDGLEKRVEAKETRMKRQMDMAADRRCIAIQQTEKSRAEEEIARINERTDKQLSRLEKKYRESKAKWVDDMVEHIIGV